jgi:hypothetical protein
MGFGRFLESSHIGAETEREDKRFLNVLLWKRARFHLEMSLSLSIVGWASTSSSCGAGKKIAMDPTG